MANAKYKRLSEYLKEGTYKVRTAVRVVREAMVADPPVIEDIFPVDEPIVISGDEGLRPAKKASKPDEKDERPSFYDFIILDTKSFEAWFTSDEVQKQITKPDGKQASTQVTRLAADDVASMSKEERKAYFDKIAPFEKGRINMSKTLKDNKTALDELKKEARDLAKEEKNPENAVAMLRAAFPRFKGVNQRSDLEKEITAIESANYDAA